MGGPFAGGFTDPQDADIARYPVLMMGIDRSMSRMLTAMCHANGYDASASVSTIEGLGYLSRNHTPYILIVNAHTTDAEEVGVLRYLKGNPILRRRLGIIAYSAIDVALRGRLSQRDRSVVDAWLKFPPSFQSLQESMSAAATALTMRLARHNATRD